MNDTPVSAPANPPAVNIPPPSVSGCAVASLVLGIVGLVLVVLGLLVGLLVVLIGLIIVGLGLILCALAVLLGIVGLIGRKRGKGMAFAGLLLGGLPVLVYLLLAPSTKGESRDDAGGWSGMSYKTPVDHARRETKNAIAVIETAAAAYEVRVGRYPNSVEDLKSSAGGRQPLLDPKKSFRDGWGHEFRLGIVDGGRFEIRSAGPDGMMDTSDDVL